MAVTDSLAGIPDRSRLEDVLTWFSASAQRYHQHLSAVLIDPDPLAHIGDLYGEDAREETMFHVAEHVGDDLRSSDIFGRSEHDELLVILPHTPVTGARILAERLRATFSEMPLALPDGSPVAVPASFGCAEATEPGTLVATATAMVSAAKAAGGNVVRG